MYVCRKCGTKHAQANVFCDGCGEYIYATDKVAADGTWISAAPGAPAAPAAAPSPAPAASPPPGPMAAPSMASPGAPPPDAGGGLAGLPPLPADGSPLDDSGPSWLKPRRAAAGGPDAGGPGAGGPGASGPGAGGPGVAGPSGAPGASGPAGGGKRVLRYGEKLAPKAPAPAPSFSASAPPAAPPSAPPSAPLTIEPPTPQAPATGPVGRSPGEVAPAPAAPITPSGHLGVTGGMLAGGDHRPAQQGLAITLEPSVVRATPGTPVVMKVRVRNTGEVVEGCTVQLLGVPADWLRVEPPEFKLYIDQDQDVTLTVTPPRTAKTDQGQFAISAEVVSKVDHMVRARAMGSMTIEPYYELTITLDPAEIDGKRSARSYLSIENKGNLTERLTFKGVEAGNRLKFAFKPEVAEVKPGGWTRIPVDVRAGRRLWGGERMRMFSIQPQRANGPAITAQQGRFTQKASFPRWVMPVMIIALAIAVPLGILLLSRSLNQKASTAKVKVPDVAKLTYDAAEASLGKFGLVGEKKLSFSSADEGSVIGQTPAKDTKVDKGTHIVLVVAANFKVPDVTNIPWEEAKTLFDQNSLEMDVADYVPGTDANAGQVALTVPKAGQVSPNGIVRVWVFKGQQVPIVNMVGQPFAVWENALKNQKIVVLEKDDVDPNNSPRGTIIGQIPAPGTVLAPGDTVTLQVSAGAAGAAGAATTAAPAALPAGAAPAGAAPAQTVPPVAAAQATVPPTAAPAAAGAQPPATQPPVTTT